MPNLHIPYVEFYIINVCNLACAGCNRFNNYNFTGYQRWSDYASVYQQWAEQVDVGSIGILGGEPLLNPTFLEWVQGINQLWHRKNIRIITNGFRLDRQSDLYAVLKKHAHGVRIKIEYNWWFHQGAIVKQDNALTLHQSDVKKAHDICHMKTCHHFIRGELYKCGVVAVLPEFDQQHTLALNTADRELMTSYRALKITDSSTTKQQFVSNLNQPIDQCRFCPEQYNGDQIFAQQKKDLK